MLYLTRASGLLYPQVITSFNDFSNQFKQNEVRDLDSLDGLWTFVREPSTACYTCESLGSIQKWYSMDLSKFKVRMLLAL